MPVIATETFKIYKDGVVAEIEAGEKFSGEMETYLVDGGCPVKPIEDDVPEPQSATQPPQASGAGASGEGGESGGADPAAAGGEPTVPDGSAKDVLAWVDGDPDRAKAAADTESTKDKPRTTLLAKLAEITGD